MKYALNMIYIGLFLLRSFYCEIHAWHSLVINSCYYSQLNRKELNCTSINLKSKCHLVRSFPLSLIRTYEATKTGKSWSIYLVLKPKEENFRYLWWVFFFKWNYLQIWVHILFFLKTIYIQLETYIYIPILGIIPVELLMWNTLSKVSEMKKGLVLFLYVGYLIVVLFVCLGFFFWGGGVPFTVVFTVLLHQYKDILLSCLILISLL